MTGEQFHTIIQILDRQVPKSARIGQSTQRSLPEMYMPMTHAEYTKQGGFHFPERPVPPAFQYQVRRYSDSGEGLVLRRELIAQLQGEFSVQKTRRKRQRLVRRRSQQQKPIERCHESRGGDKQGDDPRH